MQLVKDASREQSKNQFKAALRSGNISFYLSRCTDHHLNQLDLNQLTLPADEPHFITHVNNVIFWMSEFIIMKFALFFGYFLYGFYIFGSLKSYFAECIRVLWETELILYMMGSEKFIGCLKILNPCLPGMFHVTFGTAYICMHILHYLVNTRHIKIVTFSMK